MPRSLEEDLVDFVLGMQRGPGWRNYVQRCLEFWAEHYGVVVAEKVKSMINARMKAEKK